MTSINYATHIEGLNFGYGEDDLIKNLSIKIKSFSKTCFFGPSGCGKTTLLKLIAGLLTPEHPDQIKVNGNIGYVFQESNLLRWRTVEENILLPTEIQKMVTPNLEKLLINVGLQDKKLSLPHQLSGGMKQRTALAQCLATQADIIIMDEPFSSLDDDSRAQLYKIVSTVDKTIIFTTHNLHDAKKYSDKIFKFNDNMELINEE